MNSTPLPRNRKPDFIRREAHYRARVKKRWRYPNGRHSPLRQYHKSRPVLPTPGYGRARALKGKEPSGRKPVLVHTHAQLQRLRPEEGALFAKTIGRKKRLEMLAYAQEKGIVILGVKAISAKLDALQQKVLKQKEQKVQRAVAKIESAKKKKAAQKGAKEPAKSEGSKGRAERAKEGLSKSKPSAAAEKPGEKAAEEAAEASATEAPTAKDLERELMEKTLTKRQ